MQGRSFDTSPIEAESCHQSLDANTGQIVGVAGEMGIARGGQNAVMAQNLLNFKQVNSGFDQVSCIAVAQTVGCDLFFSPQSMATWCKVFCTPPRSSGVLAL